MALGYISFMFSRSIKLSSAIIHALLSLLIVPALILGGLSYDFDWSSKMLISISLFFAFFWGWVLSDWYVSKKKRVWSYEVYIATPVITFLAAISAGVMHAAVFSIFQEGKLETEIIPSLLLGTFFGINAFIITLPIILISGILIGVYLYQYESDE